MRVNGRLVVPRRRKYFCTKCNKFHGKAALKKWWAHRSYRSGV